jgi:hypothetical protein
LLVRPLGESDVSVRSSRNEELNNSFYISIIHAGAIPKIAF